MPVWRLTSRLQTAIMFSQTVTKPCAKNNNWVSWQRSIVGGTVIQYPSCNLPPVPKGTLGNHQVMNRHNSQNTPTLYMSRCMLRTSSVLHRIVSILTTISSRLLRGSYCHQEEQIVKFLWEPFQQNRETDTVAVVSRSSHLMTLMLCLGGVYLRHDARKT